MLPEFLINVNENWYDMNPFNTSGPFLYPLKTSENRKELEKGCIGNKWVNEITWIFCNKIPTGRYHEHSLFS